ncbi:MAG: DUF559 domain-containing protein [Rhizobiaceae bacterium]
MRKSPIKFAKQLRKNPTDAEHLLWHELRNRLLGGYKFTRQVPVGLYIVDFICRRKRLIVELDGSQHANSQYDLKRTEWLNKEGYSVLRFWNNEILHEREDVLNTLLAVLDGRISDETTGLNYSLALLPEHVR